MTDETALFAKLISANCEDDVTAAINEDQLRWRPLGGNENNFGIIENQQSSPIAALIEKITNSIDAILLRRCFEHGINPTEAGAPATMGEAIDRFFGNAPKSWHLGPNRRAQAEA